MEPLDYKGYEIDPKISPLESGGFSVTVHIETHTGSGVHDDSFGIERTYPTESAAWKAAIEAGRRIIDEKYAG